MEKKNKKNRPNKKKYETKIKIRGYSKKNNTKATARKTAKSMLARHFLL